MRTSKIDVNDISHLTVASLPTRPTAPTSYGGLGYTTAQMKEAFDALPLYIIECFNNLIEDMAAEGNESVASVIKTELSDGHTLLTMFRDIPRGDFAAYLDVGGRSLLTALFQIEERLLALEEKVNG